MVLTNEGLNAIRDLISADIDKGQMGTGTAVALASNTALQTPESNSLLTITKTTTDRQVSFNYTLGSTQGTSVTYTEYELQESSTPTNYDRIVFTGLPFTKDGSEDLIISKRYFIRSV